MLTLDTNREFRFDPKTNRYRVMGGAGKGQFISKQAFLAQTEKYIKNQTRELLKLGKDLTDLKIDSRIFQIEAAKVLKELYTSQMILGKKGFEKVSAEDWLEVARLLKVQYYSGVDPLTGKRYGLRELARDLQQGKVTPKQLLHRLELYAKNSEVAYWKGVESASKDLPYAVRHLGIAEHCQDCLEYAARGIRPKSELPLPKTKCTCKANCKCSIEFLSLEEAVRRGFTPHSFPKF